MAYNKVFLLGNLGSDINVRHMQDGRPVGNVNMATTEQWRDKAGEQQKHTEWHRLVFFGRQAEIASTYLRKGSSLFVEGKLRTREWVDNDNNKRQSTEIVVNNFQMLDKRGDRAGGGGGEGGRQQYQREQQSAPADQGAGQDAGGGLDSIDEDIPW